MKTIALFGGSFDPPHIGHETIVKALCNFDFLDKIVVMPTFLNPFKDTFFAPAELRLSWLRKMFLNYKKVIVSSYEVDKQTKVPTIESVEHLLKEYDKVYLIIGADNLKSLNRWHRFEDLKNLVTFIVATRNDIKVDDSFLKLDVKEDISSSCLRVNIQEYKLPKIIKNEILQYYKEKNEK